MEGKRVECDGVAMGSVTHVMRVRVIIRAIPISVPLPVYTVGDCPDSYAKFVAKSEMGSVQTLQGFSSRRLTRDGLSPVCSDTSPLCPQ